MIKRVLGALALVTAVAFWHSASAAEADLYCLTSSTPPFQPCSGTNPLQVTASVSATTAYTAAAALPSLSPGTQAGYESLSGGQYVQPIFGTTIVDLTHGLPVNIVAGAGAGGTSSNYGAAFPTAGTAIGLTDGTNMRALTGINYTGTSYSAATSVVQALPAGTNVIGHVITDTGSTTAVTGTVTVSGTVTANAGTGTFSVAGTGSAGTANAGVVTIQGIASMTPVQVSQATAANLNATVVGAGTAGSPSGGVVSIQGVASGTVVPVTATNLSTNLAQVNGATVNVGTGAASTGTQRVTTSTDSTIGTVTSVTAIANALPSGSNVIGHVVTDSGSLTTQTPATSGGLSVARTILANNTTSVAVKASAGQVYHIDATNNSTSVNAYFKIYNIAQGSNTCGSNTPIMTIMVPFGSGFVLDDANGFAFSTAISVCVTTGLADADTGAPAATSGTWNVGYK